MTGAELLTNVPVLIIDLEATCDEDLIESEMEIIEIGAVWVTSNGTVLDAFQALVRPITHTQLTPFCQQLTGIKQTEVDRADVPSRRCIAGELRQTASSTGINMGQLGAIRRRTTCPRLRAPRHSEPARSLRACESQAPLRQG